MNDEVWGFLPKRLHDIIIMCQKARAKYGLYYVEKYEKQIRKFSKEIEDKDLLNECSYQSGVAQVLTMNHLLPGDVDFWQTG